MSECKWCGEIANNKTKIGWLCEECIGMTENSEKEGTIFFVLEKRDGET